MQQQAPLVGRGGGSRDAEAAVVGGCEQAPPRVAESGYRLCEPLLEEPALVNARLSRASGIHEADKHPVAQLIAAVAAQPCQAVLQQVGSPDGEFDDGAAAHRLCG